MKRVLTLLTTTVALTACGAIGSGNEAAIRASVGATVAAMSTNASATLAALPTATIVPLKGLFCEYEFCIGHPDGMAFFDVVAKQNPSSPTASTFDNGDLAAANNSLFLELKWQSAPNGSDGQFMLDVILDSQVDKRSGDVQPILLRSLNIFYVSLGSTASPALPYGGAAAWMCGARAFAWKTYTTQPDLAKSLLTDALETFRCD